jgi:hypothetical protein
MLLFVIELCLSWACVCAFACVCIYAYVCVFARLCVVLQPVPADLRAALKAALAKGTVACLYRGPMDITHILKILVIRRKSDKLTSDKLFIISNQDMQLNTNNLNTAIAIRRIARLACSEQPSDCLACSEQPPDCLACSQQPPILLLLVGSNHFASLVCNQQESCLYSTAYLLLRFLLIHTCQRNILLVYGCDREKDWK